MYIALTALFKTCYSSVTRTRHVACAKRECEKSDGRTLCNVMSPLRHMAECDILWKVLAGTFGSNKRGGQHE